ncbi:SulP family inorganic anion transporter [Candidatus Poriferisodalis sp.]|uniref:SulP family inorganic anion transporter n=1 Tax=Candidatus Poriferisodalis sp. TaxID=3101277 RepID=UPI003B52BE11
MVRLRRRTDTPDRDVVRVVTAEIFGGLTSAMVMLPLALAYGVAAGLGALAGLYGAIALGFLAAVVGGTRTMISGPTALMAVTTTAVIANHADTLAEVFTITMLAGVFQVLLGLARLGRFIAYAPYSVISGFMTGIGVIIIVMQTRPLVGLPVEGGGVLATLGTWRAAWGGVEWTALVLAGVALGVMFVWPKRFRRYVPPMFAAVAVGTLVGAFWLVDAPTIGSVPTGLPELHAPEFALASLFRAIQPAATIALVGSIDTLLTARIAESMTRQPHDSHRDLLGQGLGHIATGVLGGLAGGASVCTIANIRAGARTRWSGALCALVLLALVFGAGTHVRWVPHAVLAAVLMRVGFDFIDWRFVRRLHRVQREHLVIMLITLVLTVFFDLVTAVSLGFITAALAGLRQFERLEMDRVISTPLLDRTFMGSAYGAFDARVVLVALRGSFTVASSHKLIHTIGADIADHALVILDFTDTVYIDDSAALVVDYLIETAHEQGTATAIVGLTGAPLRTLDGLGMLSTVPETHVVGTFEDARQLARSLIAAPSAAPDAVEPAVGERARGGD